MSEKTKLIISDGLNNIPETEPITDIVIAGMGGETIIKILENCPLGLRNRNFILQPMTKADLLRKNLYLLGFRLESTGQGLYLYGYVSKIYGHKI